MFTKILIANRGEIACRIIRTAKKLGIATVAVYSEADRNALHVAMADEAIHIGDAPSRESYLVEDRVIEAALKTGAQAIHPGYGFLSENASFSKACKMNQLVFIGPPTAAIEAMGSKSAAKRIMEQAQVPLVPGYHGTDQSPECLRQSAEAMGYPVLLKAVAGGGGKGMRQVWKAEEFDDALAAAKREAKSSFGDDNMLVEKYLTEPRHIEIQVFTDRYGNGVYLFERDCSVQRRHQKVIEEAPAPGVSPNLREQMGEVALRAAKAINYEGAGTVEFLLDKDGSFYFMEMNTRLQVEHPITEMITGQDLVEWQLRVAAGEKIPLDQEQLSINGHAFEARIYAEDPKNDFLPVTGSLSFLRAPEENAHVRVDTGVSEGDDISVYYDPMIAKLIVWDEDRDRALARLSKALSEYHIGGMKTNLEFLYKLCNCEDFRNANVDTGFIEKHHAEIFQDNKSDIDRDRPLAGLYLALRQQQQAVEFSKASSDSGSPWHLSNGWRLNQPPTLGLNVRFSDHQSYIEVEQKPSKPANQYCIRIGEQSVQAQGELQGDNMIATIDGHRQNVTVVEINGDYTLYTQHGALSFSYADLELGEMDAGHADGGLSAPMNGIVVNLMCEPKQAVRAGDTLMVLEAMKMEHSICAPGDGFVSEFFYQAGDMVEGGAELLTFISGDVNASPSEVGPQ